MVIPVKDDASFLDACLRSLASQTTTAHEVIVVDNNSSDDSGDVARLYGATVLHEARPGIAAAAGSGYDHATGDVIARLDADSVTHRQWIEVLTHAFDSRPDVDAFTGSATFTDGPDAWRNLAARAYLGAYFVTASSALSHPPLFGSNFAMRTAAWHSVRAGMHWSDTRIHDDFDLSFHLGRTHRIRYLSRLRLGISMRPLLEGGGLLRMTRGFRTVAIHWPHDLPWLRLARRLVHEGREPRRDTSGGKAARRFRGVLLVDGLNVVVLAASAVQRAARREHGGTGVTEDPVAVASVGFLAWSCAVASDRFVRSPGFDADQDRQSKGEARCLVWLGLLVNTIGSAGVALRASRKVAGRRVGLARAVYLLVGGVAASVAYLRCLDD